QWLTRAREMQERMERLRQELATRRIEASAGAGLVTAVATGELRILEIRIDPGLIEGGDRAMVQDLVASAVNEALRRAQEMVQSELQRAAGGLQLPFAPPSSGEG
ncbi:MAG: YbaB/EbfC family nucleoid-associated protein, partial [Myxococcota bacterium]